MRGVDARATAMLKSTRTHEMPAELPVPAPGESIIADYRATGLTLGAHPVSMLRDRLAAFRVQPAARLSSYRHG